MITSADFSSDPAYNFQVTGLVVFDWYWGLQDCSFPRIGLETLGVSNNNSRGV